MECNRVNNQMRRLAEKSAFKDFGQAVKRARTATHGESKSECLNEVLCDGGQKSLIDGKLAQWGRGVL